MPTRPDRQDDTSGHRSSGICFVVADLAGLAGHGDAGAAFARTARLLARRRWPVHALLCATASADEFARAAGPLVADGITVVRLDDFPLPPELRLPALGDAGFLRRSAHVRHALEQLHRVQRFAVIEFPARGALAFRAVQARGAGLAFTDTVLAVNLFDSSRSEREACHHWLDRPDDLRLDYCERYAFERADAQLSPSRGLLDHAARHGWTVRADAHIACPTPTVAPVAPTLQDSPREVVYLGPLDGHPALDVFFDAVGQLDPAPPVTVLGDGPTTRRLIGPDRARPLTVITDLPRARQLAYLAGGRRVAVVPDADGLAAADCMALAVPCAAASNVRDLTRALRQLLDENLVPNHCTSATPADELVAGIYASLVTARPTVLVEERPLVTVVVTHYNLGSYLPQALDSLAVQTYPRLDVLVIDDGSTCPHSRRVFEQEQARFPGFRFVRQDNAGPGKARNHGLALARGAMYVTVDADNIARPEMIERLVGGLSRNPGLAAMSCFFLAFQDSADLASGQFLHAYTPTGGPHLLALVENVYGDTNAIFRTADLRAVGGFEADRNTPWEDWETYVKLVGAGYRVDVLPEFLFYYRVRGDGRLNVLTRHRSGTYPYQHRLLRLHQATSDRLTAAEREELLLGLVSFQKGYERLSHENVRLQNELECLRQVLHHLQQLNRNAEARLRSARYRLADQVNARLKLFPQARQAVQSVVSYGVRALRQAYRKGA